eukprot:4828025-Pleurochrysis_carterae.AAC.3
MTSYPIPSGRDPPPLVPIPVVPSRPFPPLSALSFYIPVHPCCYAPRTFPVCHRALCTYTDARAHTHMHTLTHTRATVRTRLYAHALAHARSYTLTLPLSPAHPPLTSVAATAIARRTRRTEPASARCSPLACAHNPMGGIRQRSTDTQLRHARKMQADSNQMPMPAIQMKSLEAELLCLSRLRLAAPLSCAEDCKPIWLIL